ncbi:hypothetical protein SAMN04487846_2286 [Microbacterium sp. cf046]|uniref:hypothetical protein n=1 Tax=Microbacterium sp. cf046 TaxID=1761803 RepID=UPI0008F109A6|nr:hypothetical protein [Microbacterium sp. cf046]SFS07792.1 hypothetical protein SAMN04487846_2286 [Microbacterium sp. cf046]
MSFLRWIPTFLAFPLSGLAAMLLFGSVGSPLVAAAGGLLTGAVIGGAQWLALGRAVNWLWLVGSSAAVSVGMSLSVAVAGAPTTPAAAITAGAITGLLLGGVQGVLLRRGLPVAALWTALVGLSWTLGWIITSFVIVDIDRGHIVFGASGALVATVITGVALRLILGPRTRRVADHPAADSAVTDAASV